MNPKTLRAVMSALGKSKSAAKAKAARRNLAEANRKRAENPKYAGVDFTRPTRELMAELKITRAAISYLRKRRKVKIRDSN